MQRSPGRLTYGLSLFLLSTFLITSPSFGTFAQAQSPVEKLWLGCDSGGICIYDGKTFEPFTTEQGDGFENILFFEEDAADNLWFGEGKGKLFRYDGKGVTDFSLKGG